MSFTLGRPTDGAPCLRKLRHNLFITSLLGLFKLGNTEQNKTNNIIENYSLCQGKERLRLLEKGGKVSEFHLK